MPSCPGRYALLPVPVILGLYIKAIGIIEWNDRKGTACGSPWSPATPSPRPARTGGPANLRAVEVHLRPVLVELGATVPARGLYVTEPEFPTLDATVAKWAETALPHLTRALPR